MGVGLEVVGVEARAEVGVDAGAADPKNPIGHNAALLGIGHLYQVELHLRRPHTTRLFVRCASSWVQEEAAWRAPHAAPCCSRRPRQHPTLPPRRPSSSPAPLPRKVVLQGDGLNRGRRRHLAYVVTDEHSEG